MEIIDTFSVYKLNNSKTLYNKMINKSSSKSIIKKNKNINIHSGENYKQISEFDTTKITLVENINILKTVIEIFY